MSSFNFLTTVYFLFHLFVIYPFSLPIAYRIAIFFICVWYISLPNWHIASVSAFLTTTTGALDLARSSGLFSSKITPGLDWNTLAPPVSVLQREATARLSSMLPLLTSSISEGLKRFNGRFFHLRKSQRYAQIFNCCKKDDQIAVNYCIKKDHNSWHHPSLQLFILFLVAIAAVVYSIFYFFSLLDYVCKATLSDLMPHSFRPSALGWVYHSPLLKCQLLTSITFSFAIWCQFFFFLW